VGSSGGNAQAQAQAAENARQVQIAQAQRRIEETFGAPQREADIADFLNATRSYYREDANRQQGDAGRNLQFALARTGMTGGQYDVDTNRRLAETYQRGLLEADRRAQSAAASLRSADQQAKQNLLAMAQSGLDMTTATQNASQAMRNNLAGATADAREGSIGNLFSSFGDIYSQSVKQDEEKRAQRDVYRTLYQPSGYQTGYSGGGA
jgi:hypothetical protein